MQPIYNLHELLMVILFPSTLEYHEVSYVAALSLPSFFNSRSITANRPRYLYIIRQKVILSFNLQYYKSSTEMMLFCYILTILYII
jgi:hypothetical protein